MGLDRTRRNPNTRIARHGSARGASRCTPCWQPRSVTRCRVRYRTRSAHHDGWSGSVPAPAIPVHAMGTASHRRTPLPIHRDSGPSTTLAPRDEVSASVQSMRSTGPGHPWCTHRRRIACSGWLAALISPGHGCGSHLDRVRCGPDQGSRSWRLPGLCRCQPNPAASRRPRCAGHPKSNRGSLAPWPLR